MANWAAPMLCWQKAPSLAPVAKCSARNPATANRSWAHQASSLHGWLWQGNALRREGASLTWS